MTWVDKLADTASAALRYTGNAEFSTIERADRTGKPGRTDLRKDSIFRSAKFVQAI